jgi:hypothetical protein
VAVLIEGLREIGGLRRFGVPVGTAKGTELDSSQL